MRKSFFSSIENQRQFLAELQAKFRSDSTSGTEIVTYAKEKGYPFPVFLLQDPIRKIRRGVYSIASFDAAEPSVQQAVVDANPAAVVAITTPLRSRVAQNVTESFVPEKSVTYVPFGFYTDLKNIISSRIFYPVYITGLSGNGKTMMVEQVCAATKRELIRVNITRETDETDLIGSYELIDGNTIRREGPAIVAMRRGAVLLLDETDYGSERLLCLQPILEGKPYFDKKTGEVIHPAPGFNVIATANTKGKGSDDGRFIGANVLNDAFLERFAITVEQEYPPAAAEGKILVKNFSELGCDSAADLEFCEKLVTWASLIRKTFDVGGVNEVISTRRLVHIARAYSIFKNRMKAIRLCLNRFDEETKTSFLDLYTKVDQNAVESTNPPAEETAESDI